MEDIIYVLDNRINIEEEIKKDDNRISSFIKEQLQKIKGQGLLEEALVAHIHPIMLTERLPIVKEKLILQAFFASSPHSFGIHSTLYYGYRFKALRKKYFCTLGYTFLAYICTSQCTLWIS